MNVGFKSDISNLVKAACTNCFRGSVEKMLFNVIASHTSAWYMLADFISSIRFFRKLMESLKSLNADRILALNPPAEIPETNEYGFSKLD